MTVLNVIKLFTLCVLAFALAACGGTPVPPTEEAAVETSGDFRPLPGCEDYRGALAETLSLEVAEIAMEGDAPFVDYPTGGSGTACKLTARGTGADFENPWVVADAVGKMLESRGWQTDIMYQADGPTGTSSGFHKDGGLCIVSVNWEPSPDVDCPEDRPISECEIAPEQQLYEITLECALEAGAQ